VKRFNDLVDQLVPLLENPIPGEMPPAAATIEGQPPAPGAGEAPDASPQPEIGAMSPAAEVTLVRLLVKALVINIEDSDLSTITKIDQPEINQENADRVKQDIISIINSQQTRGDNEDRIEAVTEVVHSINENNRKSMLNNILKVMKKYSDVNVVTP
jgi:hypothetical protein